MSYDVINGYGKQTFPDLMKIMTDSINRHFDTDYTTDTVVGSDHFKFFYGGLQLVMETENKIAELGVKIADYIRTVNESIQAPVSSVDGTIQYFKKNLGLNVSLRAITDVSLAGKPKIAVDIDSASADFESRKQQIFDALRLSQTEGLYWFNPSTTPADNEYRGESSALNGQAFPYAFYIPREVPIYVRITVTRSRDNLAFQLNVTQIREIFESNFAKKYSIGRDFEGDTYLSTCDIKSAASIVVEWSDDNIIWSSAVREMEFDTKITLKNVEVIEG